jgi:PAS domain S-box-containing protein/putative nucleotidyltransferase with HDIG domain
MSKASRPTTQQTGLSWQAALAQSPQLACVVTAEREVVAVSRGLCEALGADAETLIGACLAAPQLRDRAPRALAELLPDGGRQAAEVHSEALGLDLLVTATPVPGEHGGAGLLLLLATDVTAQKRAEQAIHESEARLLETGTVAPGHENTYDRVCVADVDITGLKAAERVLLASQEERLRTEAALRQSEHLSAAAFYASPDLMAVTRAADGAVIEVNEGAQRLLGYAREEVLGKTTGELAIWATPQDRTRLVAALQGGGAVHNLETALRARDGRVIPCLVSARLFSYRDEECILTVSHDVSGLKRAEQELRDAEARYRAMFEENRAIKLLIDPESAEIVDASPSAADYYGYTRDQLRAMKITDINVLPAARVFEAMKGIELGQVGDFLFRHRLANGEVRHVQVNTGPIEAQGRRLLFSIIQDVTAEVEARRQLEEQRQQLQRVLAGAVGALAATVELRDPYTSGHQRRVSELATAIARRLGWSPERLADLQMAALLHDIGKIVVPAEILTKPGRLSPNEFELIKAHAGAASTILSQVEFSPAVLDAIVQHHERLDGSGYPDALRGEEITSEARVLAVADVYEAMVSHRPYRPRLTPEEAAAELRAGSGTRFDAAVVDICLELTAGGFAFAPDE